MADNLNIFDSLDGLYRGAAEQLAREIDRTLKKQDTFHLALAGGSTPRGLYQTLADEPYRSRIDWQRVHLYFGCREQLPHGQGIAIARDPDTRTTGTPHGR